MLYVYNRVTTVWDGWWGGGGVIAQLISIMAPATLTLAIYGNISNTTSPLDHQKMGLGSVPEYIPFYYEST